jgi:hypothetical protein
LPGKGQKTLTISEPLYNSLKAAWNLKKGELLQKQDIATLSTYAQKLLERGILQDTTEGRFEVLSRDQNSILVRDYFKGKNFEVVIRKTKVFCETEQQSDCEHVGFVLSDPEVIERAKQLGVKLRKERA